MDKEQLMPNTTFLNYVSQVSGFKYLYYVPFNMEKQAVAELPSVHQAALSSPTNRTNFFNILVEHKIYLQRGTIM